MAVADLVADGFGRIRGSVHQVLDGLDAGLISERIDPGANSIGWLIWHLTRVQDDHLAELAGTEQVWTEQGWADRFGLPLHPSDTGYGHGQDEVAAVRVESPDLLTAYHDAVHGTTVSWLAGLRAQDLDRIVDRAWDPPVTMGARLVSVLADDLQHVGQAAFLRGLLERR
ncbi:mycothiol transferase [Amycolatopsis nigrescens]|uniref:mycothiol transferase n=1 Tax=Amycolatopsis nigrescens TaxID=381445 RepID=UPI000476CA3D|nr:DUF664 domain-containing protein [Amycolatopsis nigrescens]